MRLSLLSRLRPLARLAALLPIALAALLLPGCNNPYPAGESAGNVIYRRLQSDIRTLDPTKSYTVEEGYIIDLIYSFYYRYHYLQQSPYKLELNLGAEEAKVAPYVFTDAKTGKQVKGESWTFKLKPGLRFQDDPCFPDGKGREIVGADVLLSFRRMADPRLDCPVVSFIQDKIIGFADFAAEVRKDRSRITDMVVKGSVPGLQADPKDPYTFRILLNQPYPQLRYLMAMHFTTPLAHEAVTEYAEENAAKNGGMELKDHPVGNGPFVMTEYLKKQKVTLRVNPNRSPEYYPTEGDPGDREAGFLEDAGNQLPLADGVTYLIMPERITAWNMFVQGYLDRYAVTQDNFSQVLGSNGEMAPAMKAKGVTLQKISNPNIYYLGFNMKDPQWGGYTPEKRKLRQAVSLAIDSQEFIDVLYEGNGQKPEWLIPPGVAGYDPQYRNPYRDSSVQKAKQLLAEAGYPNGIDPKTGERLTLYWDNRDDSAERRMFTGLLVKQIERIGVRVESRTWRDVIWQDKLDKMQLQFFTYAWFADYPDPENFVFMLYGPNISPGPNHTNYENPEYDRLFEQMRAMQDGPEREAIIKRMREISVEDCPWIYLMHREQLGLDYDWLKNDKPHGIANDGAKYWRVDGASRAARQARWNQPNYWPILGLVALVTLGSIPAASVIRQRRNRKVRRENGGGH